MTAIVLHPENGRVRIVSPGQFTDWLLGVDHGGAIAVDTETAGLGWSDDVRMVQFGDAHDGYAVCVDPKLNDAALDAQQLVRDSIKAYRGQLIFHNAAFDIHALERSCAIDCDYLWPRAINTHIMYHVLDCGAMSKGLKEAAKRFDLGDCGASSDALKLVMDGKELSFDEYGEPLLDKKGKQKKKRKKGARKWTWGTIPLLLLAKYGVMDTMLTWMLWDFLNERLSHVEHQVVATEMEASVIVYEIETKGMRLDYDYALQLQETWETLLRADRGWFAAHGVANPNADADIINVLMDQGWKPTKFAAKGMFNRVIDGEFVEKKKKPLLDKKVIESIADEYPVAHRLLEYKRINKWKAAYTDNCIEQMDSNGRVHARYNTLGAKTGRMSCSNPPLQQLPKGGGGEVRSMFIASEGNVICSVDYSAIELRLAGALAMEPGIIEAYEHDIDLYQQTADLVGCTRPQAKVVVLASLYGAGGKTIAKGLGVENAEGMRLKDGFWSAYPTLSQWNISMTSKARGGRVKSTWGRTLAPHQPYAAANAVIQGTAAEVLKGGMLRMAERGLIKYVCAIVHDEVVGDVPIDEAEQWVKDTQAALADLSFAVPITANGEVYGRSWGDGYSADAIPNIEEIAA